MEKISKSQLKEALDNQESLLLVDVLSADSFNHRHIPGAINIPLKENVTFAQQVQAKARSKDQRIIVYCASTRCDASEKAAEKLENAGFTNIVCYEKGLEGWFEKSEAAA